MMSQEEQAAAAKADAIAAETASEHWALDAATLALEVSERIGGLLSTACTMLSTQVGRDNDARIQYGAPGARFKLPDAPQTWEMRVNEMAAIEMERLAIEYGHKVQATRRAAHEAADAAYRAALAAASR